MSIPAWLKSVMDECSACCLEDPTDREFIARAITAKLEELSRPIAACISSAAHARIKGRAIVDHNGDIARDIGKDATASLLMMLGRSA